MPKRIQLSRKKGWRKPEGAVVVARPTKWGNPYKVGETYGGFSCNTAADAVWAFGMDIRWNDENSDRMTESQLTAEKIAELRGKDLACWCPLDGPCHADVLLKIANR